MTSLRDRMAAQTANLRSTGEISADETKRAEKPKTAPGMMAALTAAQLRIQELEELGAAGEIAVSAIRPNPKQPRIAFDDGAIQALAQSIEEIGLMQPVVVRRDPTHEGQYQLIAGERRWRAHQRLGKDSIRAVVADIADADLAVLALAENIAREDLTDFEIGQSLKQAETEFPSRKRMAEALGVSRAHLYRYYAFDSLPDFVLESLRQNPALLGGSAASETAAALKRAGAAGLSAMATLWPEVVSGNVEQTKLARLIERAAHTGHSQSAGVTRESRRLYAGKHQVGSISKDEQMLTLKIKTSALSSAKEAQLRELVSRLFQDQPE